MRTSKIIFATGNSNKVREIEALLTSSLNYQIIGLAQLGHFEELEETGDSLEANAIQKAEFIFNKYGEPTFAEDTGLEIPALNNAPGIYSARYAGPRRNSMDNMQKVLSELKGNMRRQAHFRTVIAYKSENGILLFEGKVKGQISNAPEGEGGFGYDPIFVPDGFMTSFGKLPSEIKYKISHRTKAWNKLKSHLQSIS